MNNNEGNNFKLSDLSTIDLTKEEIQESLEFLKEHGFECEKIIGFGLFGVVFLAKVTSTNGKSSIADNNVAIKLVCTEDIEGISSYQQTCQLMQKIDSMFAVRIVDFLSREDKNQYFTIMEYHPNGNLKDFLETKRESLTDEEIAKLIISFLQGLKVL